MQALGGSASIAASQDKYRLYLESVQSPKESADELDRVWEESGPRRKPRLFIEDFSGAAALSAAWLAKAPERRAIAVDIDPVPQAWGQAHLPPAALERIQYETVSVLDHDPAEKADIIAAMNFSWLLFTTRNALREYFESCHRRLAPGGILIMDLMAGTDAAVVGTEARIVKGKSSSLRYKYFWSCRSYNALTALGTWTISWKFSDGSVLKHAFKYDWRLWTVPEVTEILTSLGFKVTHWVDVAEDEDEVDLKPVTTYAGSGVYLPYIVAQV
jgi:SAM-dependent methyltransferase